MKAITLFLIFLLSVLAGCSEDSDNSTSSLDDTDKVADDGTAGDDDSPDTDEPDTDEPDDDDSEEPDDDGEEPDDGEEDPDEEVDEPDEPVSGDGFIIFDNFENDVTLSGDGETNTDAQTDLGASFNYFTDATDKYYDGGYWYAYDDSGDKGNSTATPDYIADDTFEAGLSQDGETGQALQINITLGDAVDDFETAFYGVGANIRGEGEYFDFSPLTSISFDVKGSGEMVVKFLTKVTDAYTWGDMAADFALTADWSRITIPVEDIAPEAWSPTAEDGITWADTKSHVGKIHFQTYGNVEKAGSEIDFAIDNITLEGFNSYDDVKLAE